MSKLENKFQQELKKELKQRFPGCMVIKNDPNYIQGLPDLTVFYGSHWATLECKRDRSASHRPNQEYYVETMNNMSFSAFIYPENKEEVLNDMERSFKRP